MFVEAMPFFGLLAVAITITVVFSCLLSVFFLQVGIFFSSVSLLAANIPSSPRR